MGSHPRLSLSVEAPPYASQRYPRTAAVTTSKPISRVSHIRQTDDRRMTGVQGGANRSGGTPANRRVQTQLPHYFSSPATSASTPRSTAAAPSSSSASADDHIRGGTNYPADVAGSGPSRNSKRRRTSPDASMLGKAPPSTLKAPRPSTQNAVQSACESVSSNELEEEEAWMRRARVLTGRHEENPAVISSSPRRQKETSDEASKNKQASASAAPRRPHTAQAGEAVRAVVPPRSPAQRAAVKEPSSPFQETPWLHDSLSELSMLPWERDAALKLPQYRTSAGSKPTERDLQIKRNMEQAIAQKAQQEAIARSLGLTVGRWSNADTTRSGPASPRPAARTPARGSRPEKEVVDVASGAALPPPADSENELPYRKRPITPMMTPQLFSKRAPLLPRSIPNSSKEQSRPALSDAGLSGDEDQERPGHLATPSIRHPQVSAGVPRSKDVLPATPTPELPAIRSPRSKRKVYALETQDGAPLPTPFDIRAAGIRRLPNKLHSGSRGPATPRVHEEEAAQRQTTLDRRGSSTRQRSGQSDRDASTPRKLRDHLLSVNRLSPRSNSKKRAREARLEESSSDVEMGGGGYAADSSSPLQSPGETQMLGGDYDDEADETVLPTRAIDQSLRGTHVPPESGSRRSSEKEDEAVEETQPLPFLDADDTSDDDEEDLLVSRPPPNKGTGSSRRVDAQAVPFLQRATQKPTGWATVNAAWEGLNLNDTRRVQTGDREQQQPTLGHYGFDESTRAKRSAARPLKLSLPNAPELSFDHPLSRDVTDHLTDDEDAEDARDADDSGFVDGLRDAKEGQGLSSASKGARGTPTYRDTSILAWSKEVVPDSQATQPLAWDEEDDSGKKSHKSPRSDTQDTSNTEDEAVLPMDVLKRMRTKMTEWPQGGIDRRRGIRSSSHAAANNIAATSVMSEGGESGDSDGWVPDMPSQMESFFERL
ncbi:hypothetical protein BCV69DRAFT_279627 [Microstroma glucosiphilum]|uniref:Uncharacterized protein n=1 Tax=Pseudomicrostroma glucosiphilum TaxID=1684307 RepID=A0A316UEP6_9BASI|nr:hypothetical protein BCV69DRAFT_279627 [Pseudomicrostroma glucosiphilum]PWN23699.1 hypothetical protein BCV69DRAFT_279627 [Pseudomicrostroma glucosiphilum]